MINLLPLASRNRVQHIYRLRWIGVGAVLLAGIVASALVLLIPPYVLTLSREDDALSRKNDVEQLLEKKKGAEATDVVSDLNYTLDQLEAFEKTPDVMPVLASVLSAKRTGISVDSVSVELIEGKSGIIITGVASTREALLQFSQELKRLPTLTSVTLPVSDLGKASNSTFTISALMSVASSTGSTSTP